MNTQQERRCVLYARLSVTKEESVSIARQLQSCRRYAEARGWEVIGEFIDDGVSATANRPEDRNGWAALLSVTDFDAVIIWKVDRLARRVLDFLHADEALQKRGAGLVAVEDPIDMTSPQGRAFAVMLAVFGEMEAEAIRARVRAARAQLLKDGRWAGGGVPFGYQSAPNPDGPGWVLVKDSVRQPWLTEIVRRALDGSTVNAITTWLTSAGAPLPEGSMARRKSDSTAWNRQTVDGILRNPVLAGMTPHNPGRPKSAKRADPFAVFRDDDGEPVVNNALAVISAEEFAILQELLDLGADAFHDLQIIFLWCRSSQCSRVALLELIKLVSLPYPVIFFDAPGKVADLFRHFGNTVGIPAGDLSVGIDPHFMQFGLQERANAVNFGQIVFFNIRHNDLLT